MTDETHEPETNEPNEHAAAPPSPETEPAPIPPPPGEGTEGERPRIGIGPDGTVGPVEAPERSFLSRVPMRFKIGVPLLLIALGVGWWSSRGETNADDLGVGDCFQLPGDEFTEVQDQDCAGVHEAELYAFVNLPVGTAWPGGGSFEVSEAMGEACALASETVDINIENLPADQYIGYFFPAESEWERTGREVLCYVASPTGLPGPVLAG